MNFIKIWLRRIYLRFKIVQRPLLTCIHFNILFIISNMTIRSFQVSHPHQWPLALYCVFKYFLNEKFNYLQYNINKKILRCPSILFTHLLVTISTGNANLQILVTVSTFYANLLSGQFVLSQWWSFHLKKNL